MVVHDPLPAPVNVITWKVWLPCSTNTKVAALVPVPVGRNATLTVQEAPAASVVGRAPQLSVSVKSPPKFPENAMSVIVDGPGPLLVTVSGCVALAVPMA